MGRGQIVVRADATPNARAFGDLSFSKEEQPAPRVLIVLNGEKRCVRLHWEHALGVGQAACRAASKAESLGPEGKVLLIVDGALKACASPEGARQVGVVLIRLARKVEEVVKHVQVATDSAILLRAGHGGGLASDPRVVRESVDIAVNDRDLRRFMPGGVKSDAVILPPAVVQEAPTLQQSLIFNAWKESKKSRRAGGTEKTQ